MPMDTNHFYARAVRIAVLLATTLTGVLLISLLGNDLPYSTIEATGLAMATLLASLPLVDSVLFGRSVRPETAGAVFGLSLGFFLRQAQISPELASGSGRVMATALFGSLLLGAWRWYRGRQST